MRHFELYYKNYLIGNIDVDNNTFLYLPNSKVIEEIKDNDIIFIFLKETIKEPHPFITSRINNMDKFNLKSIKYEGSSYELKEII